MLFHGSVVVLVGMFAAAAPAKQGYVIEAPDIMKIDVGGLPKKAQPIRGERLVRPDGTVSLGVYGSVPVSGLTPEQARKAILEHLAGRVKKKRADKLAVQVEVAAFNSKFYYVVTDFAGAGEQVARIPLSGNETVLDTISHVGGRSAVTGKKVWVARPAPAGTGDQILWVDWKGITRRGQAETNYQILPGDRVFIADRSRPK
jgi:protein involved in polysaccharide export with SLBB domain